MLHARTGTIFLIALLVCSGMLLLVAGLSGGLRQVLRDRGIGNTEAIFDRNRAERVFATGNTATAPSTSLDLVDRYTWTVMPGMLRQVAWTSAWDIDIRSMGPAAICYRLDDGWVIRSDCILPNTTVRISVASASGMLEIRDTGFWSRAEVRPNALAPARVSVSDQARILVSEPVGPMILPTRYIWRP